MSPVLQALSIILSASATIIGMLVLYNLRMLSKRLDEQERRISRLEADAKSLAARKQDCQQEFIGVGHFLREAGYTRRRLDDVVEAVKELGGKFEVISQLPQIAGQIASNTVKEMMSLVNSKD